MEGVQNEEVVLVYTLWKDCVQIRPRTGFDINESHIESLFVELQNFSCNYLSLVLYNYINHLISQFILFLNQLTISSVQ